MDLFERKRYYFVKQAEAIIDLIGVAVLPDIGMEICTVGCFPQIESR